jgi:hypothetical protein
MTVMAPVSSKKMDSAASGSWENYHMVGGHMHNLFQVTLQKWCPKFVTV